MKVRELMSKPVVRIHADEPVSVAARTLTHYNIGALPVCDRNGRVCGMLTDRDIVTRCLAADRDQHRTKVSDVMTGQVQCIDADADVTLAAHMMGAKQLRRLPVLEHDRLCGVISLGDLANSEPTAYDAADALSEITSNISHR